MAYDLPIPSDAPVTTKKNSKLHLVSYLLEGAKLFYKL